MDFIITASAAAAVVFIAWQVRRHLKGSGTSLTPPRSDEAEGQVPEGADDDIKRTPEG